MPENRNFAQLSAEVATPPSSHQKDAKGRRETWIDAVRGLAVLGMLEAHVMGQLLAPLYREGEAYHWLLFLNGLVAPAFLWIAGYVHGLGWQRRRLRENASSPSRPPAWPWRSLRRLMGIGALGFFLHFPWAGMAEGWQAFWAPDVLACLAASLLLVIGIEHFAFTSRARAIALGLATVVAIVAGAFPPWAIGWWPIDAWFDRSGVALFPLIPWCAFVFLGSVMGQLDGTAASRPHRFWSWLGIGVLLAAVPQAAEFDKAHPAFFGQRFGWLLVLLASGRALALRIPPPRWLLFVGRESLFIYVTHLLILFGAPWQQWAQPRYAPLTVAAVSLLLMLLCVALAWGYREARRRFSARQ